MQVGNFLEQTRETAKLQGEQNAQSLRIHCGISLFSDQIKQKKEKIYRSGKEKNTLKLGDA